MVILIDLPICRQETKYTCGVAVLKSILKYFGNEIAEDRLSKTLHADKENGTNPNYIYDFLKKIIYCHQFEHLSLQQVQQEIDNHHPIIVLLQAWGDDKNYKNDWNDGHYAIIIGYDNDRLYFMDPSSTKHTFIYKEDFVRRWHDRYDNRKSLNNLGLMLHHNFKNKSLPKEHFIEMK